MVKYFRDENSQLKKDLEKKTKALDLLISENKSVKAQLEEVMLKLKDAEAENRKLIDRRMLEKMKDAKKLNKISCFLLTMIHVTCDFFLDLCSGNY